MYEGVVPVIDPATSVGDAAASVKEDAAYAYEIEDMLYVPVFVPSFGNLPNKI